MRDRVLANKRQRRIEERLAPLLDSIRMLAVVRDLDGTVQYVNPYFQKVTGYRAEELAVQPELACALPFPIVPDLESIPAGPDEAIFPSKSNGERTIRWNSGQFYDDADAVAGILSIGEDITDYLRTAQLARTSEDRFRSAFDWTPVGMAILDLEGRYVQANPGFTHITGYSADELRGQNSQYVSHPADVNLELPEVQRLRAGEIESVRIEKRLRHRDGATVWI